MLRWTLVALCSLGANGVALGGTLVVPDEYETIEDACNAAVADDVVLVEPGFYLGPVPIAPGVTVRSVAGPEQTNIGFSTVEGGPITFQSGPGIATLEGFQISMEDFPGVGVHSFNPQTIIRNNTFTGGGFGGAVCIQLEMGGLIEDNRLGGEQFTGISITAGTVTLSRNVLYAPDCTGAPGGIFLLSEDTVETVSIVHNTLISQSELMMFFRDGPSVSIKNNLLGNFLLRCLGDPAAYDVSYNLVAGFWTDEQCPFGPGNLVNEGAPTFCDPLGCDLRLTPESLGADDGEGGVPMGALGIGCEPIVAVEHDGWPPPPSLRMTTPNPSNRSIVELAVTMPEAGAVSIVVFNVRGAAVQRDAVYLGAGRANHRFALTEGLPPSVYFLRAATTKWQKTIRLNVIR